MKDESKWAEAEKVARRVVQKYSGTMATEPRGELFAVKIVMPLTRG